MQIDKNYINQLLNRSQIMQIATSDNDKPWVCTVYFVADDDLSIYWLSWPERRHSQELVKNPNVAITMAIKQDIPVIGLGGEGVVSVAKDHNLVRKVMDLYIQKYGSGHAFYDRFIAGNNHHVMYQFTPNKFVLFDEVNFPENKSIDYIVK